MLNCRHSSSCCQGLLEARERESWRGLRPLESSTLNDGTVSKSVTKWSPSYLCEERLRLRMRRMRAGGMSLRRLSSRPRLMVSSCRLWASNCKLEHYAGNDRETDTTQPVLCHSLSPYLEPTSVHYQNHITCFLQNLVTNIKHLIKILIPTLLNWWL